MTSSVAPVQPLESQALEHKVILLSKTLSMMPKASTLGHYTCMVYVGLHNVILYTGIKVTHAFVLDSLRADRKYLRRA